MPLPSVKLGGLQVSRLIVGGNPFSGHAHKPGGLREEMLDYYTNARIAATLFACEAQGINTFLGRADAHILRALREYRNQGGRLQWIAQTAPEMLSLERNIREAVAGGAQAVYLHGGWLDQQWEAGNIGAVRDGLAMIRDQGVPAGIAAHVPRFHLEAAEQLDFDFHMVCCFNCGSVHAGRGEQFVLDDVPVALDAIARLERPCIAYKVLGAGRYDPEVMLPQVYGAIKPSDLVLMGFWTKYHTTQVEDTVALVEQILAGSPAPVAD